MSKRDDLEIIVAASTEQLASDLGRAQQMLRAFAKNVERNRPPQMPTLPSAAYAAAPWRAAERAVASFSSTVRAAASGITSFASRAASTAAGLAAYQAGLTGVSGALDTVRDSVKLAADLEQTQVAFEVMLGSAEKATRTVSDLRKFAAETPFNSRETMDAARQLLAYGTAADQLIPTLKVLGNISASNPQGAPLGDVAYLFGTLKTQGRAFSRDIYQFAGRGIDIIPELAKQFGVAKQEVMGLVEEGKVGFPEVAKALEALTSAGGRFHGMMDRQSKTLRGMWEIAADAWQVAKTRFGQIIIEEAGLKDATRDFESFAKRVEQGMERVRPAVRFVADLAKGAAQLGYEFGRAGLKIAEMNLEGAARAFPELQNVREMIRDLQNFKISPERINRLGLDVFRGLGMGFARALDFVQTEGRDYYEGFKKYFIDPIAEMVGALKSALDAIRSARDSWRGLWEEAFGNDNDVRTLQTKRRMFAEGGFADPGAADRILSLQENDRKLYEFRPKTGEEYARRFGPRRADETELAFARRFQELEGLIGLEHGLANAPWLTEGSRKDSAGRVQELLDTSYQRQK